MYIGHKTRLKGKKDAFLKAAKILRPTGVDSAGLNRCCSRQGYAELLVEKYGGVTVLSDP